MKKLRNSFDWFPVIMVSMLLVALPLFGCKGAKGTAEEEAKIVQLHTNADSLAAEGDFAGADALRTEAQELQDEMNARESSGLLGLALGFIPGMPPTVKLAAVGVLGPALASVFYKRPREHFGAALSGIARSVMAINPVGSSIAPRIAFQELIGVGASIKRGFGLEHTTNDPKQLMANAVKLRARQDFAAGDDTHQQDYTEES